MLIPRSRLFFLSISAYSADISYTMHLKALPLFVSLVVGLAAPDPSPAPDADLVADLLERQITASAPGVGATVNSERYEWFYQDG